MLKRNFKRKLSKEYKLKILLFILFAFLALLSWYYHEYSLTTIIGIGSLGFFLLAMSTKKYD